jgi:Icc-related predicted phosphoesterase
MRSPAEPCSPITVAAGADLHARHALGTRLRSAVDQLEGVDLILLAGDLTATGKVDEARTLADAVRNAPAPTVAVLGNHDHHGGVADEIAATLAAAGVEVLDGGVTVREIRGRLVGVTGTKGFVGGFRESRLPDFGEPLLRAVYAETTREVESLERGLQAVAECDIRIVLLHYAPTSTTLAGERETVWTFLGSERLGAPIARHCPDLVIHGHAHAGCAQGAIGSVPVFNVAAPVVGGDFRVFTGAVPDRTVRGLPVTATAEG